MATFLYRIAQWSARRAGRVIAAWLVLLGMAVGSFFVFGGTLEDQFSIPGTETERVNAELEQELDASATGAAGVVFHTADGEQFSDAQREQISDALEDLAGFDEVTEVIDPFDAEAQRLQDQAEMADGRDEIAEHRDELEQTEAELEQAEPELTQAETELAQGIEQLQAQMEAPGTPEAQLAAMTAQLAEMEGQLDEVQDQLAEVQAGLEQVHEGREELEAESAELARATELTGFADDIRTVSAGGDVAQATVIFTDDVFSLPQDVKESVMDFLGSAAIEGVQVDYSGELAASVDGLIGTGEVIGVIAAAIALLVVFRALRPAALPILSSLVGVGIAVAGSMAFSGVVEMTTVTPVLGLMLGLAVGIDYSLFIIYRHRRQVREGMGIRESIGLAGGTAGTAVFFAGLTTMIALLALAVTGIEFLTVMGIVGAVAVVLAVPVATTFTPALLGVLGDRVLNRQARSQRDNGGANTHLDPRPMSHLRAAGTVVVGVAVLGVLAIPALDMRLGLPDGSMEDVETTSYQAFAITADAFGEGHNGPLVVTADLPEPVAGDDELQTQLDLARPLAEREDITAVAPLGFSDDGGFLALQVIPAEGPSSASTENLVHDLRDTSPLADGTALGVAGFASGNIDLSNQLADALPTYLVVVFGLAMLILIGVFRSFLVPVLTAAGLALSLFAALGATTAVFQWGWISEIFGVHTPGPLLSFLPLLLTGVLFGLAMDYQLFMVSPMREAYAHGTPAREAVTVGFRAGRVVVAAAAVIMIAVFGGFAFSQLAMIRPIGFALAAGVLFDAFVVRMLIIPAAMHLLGRSAWWIPRWLDRILPNVDVEGLALEQERAAAQAGEVQADDDAAPARSQATSVTASAR